MKNIASILLLLTLTQVAPSSMAVTNGFAVPDGGATALLLGIGAAGLVTARRYFGKK